MVEQIQKKYFGTDGIRGKVGASFINPEFVLKLGWAVGRVLATNVKHGRGKVLIGKDTRVSGYMLESALEAGLSAAGVDIRLLGPMPTPAIAYLTRTFRAQAGIVISASHNPHYDNGIKFFSAEGNKLPDEIEIAIEEQLEKPLVTVESNHLGKASRIVDAPGRYIEFCKSTIPPSVRLNGLKIVVDCANGATYHIAPNVYKELGAEVVAIGTRPDGFNINKECGSTQPSLLQQTVLSEKADLGIALDGDGDRLIMVDHRGEILDGDDLVFIIACHSQKQHENFGGVVGTVMSNYGLEKALQKNKIPFARTFVGDRHILSELQQRGWLLGAEPSGHIVHLGAMSTGDGIIASLRVLAAMHDAEKRLHDLKKGLIKYPQAKVNIHVNDASHVAKLPEVQQAIREVEKQLNGHGRVLVRPSGTEPVIRVMVEGEELQTISQLANQIAVTVEKYQSDFE